MSTLAARRSFAVLFALAAAGTARAEFYQPPSLSTLFDTSIRSAAMGGASAAVTWGEPGVWANPATLAGVNGIGWVAGHTKIATLLEGDNIFASQRLILGGGGIGVSLMGKPISGLGKARVDLPGFASLPFVTPEEPFDQTEGFAVGGSPLKLIESVLKLSKMSPRALTSFGDVAVGYQGKTSTASNGSFTFGLADTYDWGVTGRLVVSRWWGPDAPFRVNLSGAYSQINMLTSESKQLGETATQFDRTAVALRVSPAPPSERSSTPPSLPWWRPGDVPELTMGLAYDHERRHFEPFGLGFSKIDHYGLEATVFRLLALRLGYLSDHDDDINGMTYGGGITLPIGPWGSVGYELASVPFGVDVEREFRQGWSVWLDPTRLWADAR
jgi:hypothetical protein